MFASTDSLVLIIRVTLEKLTSKPSPFSNLISQLGEDLAYKEARFMFACNWKLLA